MITMWCVYQCRECVDNISHDHYVSMQRVLIISHDHYVVCILMQRAECVFSYRANGLQCYEVLYCSSLDIIFFALVAARCQFVVV